MSESDEHNHTCPLSSDHHCPGCCSCECCSRHKIRPYKTHKRSRMPSPRRRRYRYNGPVHTCTVPGCHYTTSSATEFENHADDHDEVKVVEEERWPAHPKENFQLGEIVKVKTDDDPKWYKAQVCDFAFSEDGSGGVDAIKVLFYEPTGDPPQREESEWIYRWEWPDMIQKISSRPWCSLM